VRWQNGQFQKEDITDELKQKFEKRHAAAGLKITEDIYENEEYIRMRLGNPAPGSYDPVIAKYYIKRLDTMKL
jgi:hypothetical protein